MSIQFLTFQGTIVAYRPTLLPSAPGGDVVGRRCFSKPCATIGDNYKLYWEFPWSALKSYAPSERFPASPLRPHLSIADVMRASTKVSADGIWAVEGAEKLSEEECQLVRRDTVNLTAATTLLEADGTGKKDRQWVIKADWQS